MIRPFFLTLIILLCSLGLIRAADIGTYTALQQKDLNAYFTGIQVGDGNLVFTRSMDYLALQMQIGITPKTDCLPGTMFEVPFGTACRLFNNQSSLKLIPPAPKAAQSMFLVEKVNQRGDVRVGVLIVNPDRKLQILPAPVTDKDSLFKFEKGWVLGAGPYPKLQ